jgi:maleylacetoacetate isomerase
LKLTQSIAILEYLEEAFPEKPLLPKDPRTRAVVRNLVNVLSNDVQPVTNLRILAAVEKVGGSRAEWAKDFLQNGLNGMFSLAICWNSIDDSIRGFGEGIRWKIFRGR